MHQFKLENNKWSFKIDAKTISVGSEKNRVLNNAIKGRNSLIKVIFNEESIFILGVYFYKDAHAIINHNLNIMVNNKKCYTKKILKIPFFSYNLYYYYSIIKCKDLDQDAINNSLYMTYENSNGFGFVKRLSYKISDGKKSKFRSTKFKRLDNDTIVYIKQTSKNGVNITKRNGNLTDNSRYKLRIMIAKFISNFMKKNKIILYEKELQKYEESASVLFEELQKRGFKKCYYIIDKKSKQIANIPAIFSKNIIYKGSFRNYLYFFTAKTFLGTELIDHAVDLRVKNRCIEKFIFQKKYKFVFLQHGVMYILSLSSSSRQFFKKGEIIGENGKIVVSSLLEAENFINNAGYSITDLYITGLPKFDKNYRYKYASRIVIMLTWRPWEYHTARKNPLKTTYYRDMMEIYNSIPLEFREKVIMLPHPLFLSLVKGFNIFKIDNFNSYDEILKNTDLLITDYSSISLDAFSRGCNVIFWWKNIESSMKKYGGKLLLDKTNVYGDICYEEEELSSSIFNLYMHEQPRLYVDKYKKIVQFSDKNNTNRLIECLIRDKMI